MLFFKHNWHWKFLSVALAVGLSFFVRRQEYTLRRTVPMRLNLAVPETLRLVEPDVGTRVEVALEGPAEIVRDVEPEDIRVSADISGVRPGESTLVPVQVELTHGHADRIETSWRPTRIRVKLATSATRDLRVVVLPENQVEGWELVGSPLPNPAFVRVSGPAPAVQRVTSVVARIRLEPGERINSQASLQAIDRNGEDVTELVQLSRAQVQVTGAQQRVVAQRRIFVQPVLQAPPGPGLSVQVTPSMVRALGPVRALRDLFVVETPRIQVPKGPGRLSRTVRLVSPQEEVRLEPASVRVTVTLRVEQPAPPPAPVQPAPAPVPRPGGIP